MLYVMEHVNDTPVSLYKDVCCLLILLLTSLILPNRNRKWGTCRNKVPDSNFQPEIRINNSWFWEKCVLYWSNRRCQTCQTFTSSGFLMALQWRHAEKHKADMMSAVTGNITQTSYKSASCSSYCSDRAGKVCPHSAVMNINTRFLSAESVRRSGRSTGMSLSSILV